MNPTHAEQTLQPVASAYGTNARWLRVRIADYFGRLDFTGLRVLDVGAGNGLYACCLAALGAEQVVALEPEMAGSRQGAQSQAQQRASQLSLTNLESQPMMLQEHQATAGTYDIIYMVAVINHLDETHVQTLHTSAESQEVFCNLLLPTYDWLKPGGQLMISDASRHHAYEGLIRMGVLKQHPFFPQIEWTKHQPPMVWADVLRQVGFTSIDWHWATNWRYPRIPRPLVDNSLAAWLYSTLFVLSASR